MYVLWRYGQLQIAVFLGHGIITTLTKINFYVKILFCSIFINKMKT